MDSGTWIVENSTREKETI